MQIKNQTFYHIHKIGAHSSIWQVGKRINWVRKNVNLFNSFYDTHGLITDKTNGNGPKYLRNALAIFKQQPLEYQNQELAHYFNLLETAVKEQGMFIRETIFEEVRAEYFPHLPSRKTCIWVFEPHTVEYWWNTLDTKNAKIFELNLTGSMHRADQKNLQQDTFDHDTFRSLAFNYWTGTDGDKKIEEEILFEGVINVVREFANMQEMQKNI